MGYCLCVKVDKSNTGLRHYSSLMAGTNIFCIRAGLNLKEVTAALGLQPETLPRGPRTTQD